MSLVATLRRRAGTVREWLRARGEGGFTLVEISLVAVLGAVVSASILGILTSQTSIERRISTFTVNHEEVRQAIVALARDLRSAEPLSDVGSAVDMQYRVDLKMYEDVTSDTPFKIRWRLDTTTGELVREQIATDGTVAGTTYRLRGVVNGTEGVPLFTYYRANNTAYDLALADTSSGTVAYCTVRVGVDLRAAPNTGGGAPVRLVSDVQLRNKLPGADECPQ